MRFIRMLVLWLISTPSFSGNVFTTDYARGSDQQKAAQDEIVALGELVATKVWSRIDFPHEGEGFGDAGVAPFGDTVEYKVNAVNYNLYFGDSLKVPFQLYYGELASTESPQDANEKVLLDPTQGIAIQFPVAYRYRGRTKGGFCYFDKLKGYCVAGGDLTVRGVRVNEVNDSGKVIESLIFGASTSLRVSVLFPIFRSGVPGTQSQSGHLGASIGGRYYYHNTDSQNLLFGQINDPTGSSVTFDKEFGALTAESEFDIYQYFKIRLEYFRPLANRDLLGDVFRASIVFAPQP